MARVAQQLEIALRGKVLGSRTAHLFYSLRSGTSGLGNAWLATQC
jgi:hypothetical protein